MSPSTGPKVPGGPQAGSGPRPGDPGHLGTEVKQKECLSFVPYHLWSIANYFISLYDNGYMWSTLSLPCVWNNKCYINKVALPCLMSFVIGILQQKSVLRGLGGAQGQGASTQWCKAAGGPGKETEAVWVPGEERRRLSQSSHVLLETIPRTLNIESNYFQNGQTGWWIDGHIEMKVWSMLPMTCT